MSSPSPASGAGPSTPLVSRVIDIRVVLGLLRSYWPGLVVGVLLGAAAAYVYTATQPKIYAADASGIVTTGPTSGAGEASVADQVAKSRAASYVPLATSRSVAARVIDKLHLDTSPAALVGQITASNDDGTVLIDISAVSSSPSQAKQLADAWIEALAAEIKRIEAPTDTTAAAEDYVHLEPVESAELPTAPISPSPKRNELLGVMAGLVLGAGYGFVRFRLDRRIHGSSDVAAYGVTVAGVIPLNSAFAKRRGVSVESARDLRADSGAPGEAIRKLRTNLQFMDIDDPPRTIVVTSPLPGDGKSTVAANLAVALSASERPVVIIDADLRRPVQADSFGLAEGAGLTDVLIGRATFEQVAQRPAQHPALIVLAAGRVPPNPSELLGSRTMGKLLAQLADTYTVVVDAPPLLPVTDAAVLTANADGALIVLSAGSSLDVQLGEAIGNVRAVNGHVLGVVLNKVKRGVKSGYYGYSYDYAPASAGRSAPLWRRLAGLVRRPGRGLRPGESGALLPLPAFETSRTETSRTETSRTEPARIESARIEAPARPSRPPSPANRPPGPPRR
ncbi:polysaccharide biosynthesis tyrosine autokinase [Nocardioides mangrovicus]|uniref:Polysaccharide biosynthesis tyrosine autokinase n=1 Tax=Nocardioides mangrovicus TaxID=2478913 RepID=A0A3L8P6G2_9ACTN|nr:polysaccharide biosynthesis tyrosine autokinase [Nocardioides mangrovicus]RLV50028.1 polysaccharide biosynthesis tyrosine autokinase [Nocardioides mangrovicus]